MKTAIILFIVTSHTVLGNTGKPTGLWLEELAAPYYAFKDAGYEVEIVSIAGGEVPLDPRSLEGDAKTPSVQRFLADGKAMALIRHSSPVQNVDVTRYAALFLPGGHGTMWDLPGSKALARVVSEAWNGGRVVSAVCHGPAGLVAAVDRNGDPIVKGRKVAAFTNSEEAAVGLTEAVPFLLETRLRELGAQVQTAPDFTPFAVADGRLVTGQNPASSEKVAKLVMQALEQK